MRNLAFLSTFVSLSVLWFAACDGESPTVPEVSPEPAFSTVQNSQGNGASVINNGAKDLPDFWCRGQGFVTDDVTVVLRPTGGALLSCQWDGLPEIENTVVRKKFSCFLSYQGLRTTNRTRQTRTPSGQQSMTCVFD